MIVPLCFFPGMVEALHDAAYKNALSNSLYCPNHMVGKIHSDHVSIFPSFLKIKGVNTPI